MEEIDDQARMMGMIIAAHLRTHNGQPDPSCNFCKGFIQRPEEPIEYPLSSYKLIFLDVNE